MTNFFTEDFEGVTIPALPTGFSVSSSGGAMAFTTEVTTVSSGTQALQGSTGGAANGFFWGSGTVGSPPNKSDSTTSGTKGDDSFSADINIGAVSSAQAGVCFRMKGDPGTNSNLHYLAMIQGNSGITLKWRNAAGTLAAVTGTGTVGASGTFTVSTWYRITGRALGTNISVTITALTGANAGKYLDNTGTWVSGITTCFNATDSNVPTGLLSFAGVKGQTNGANIVFFDNLSFDEAVASTPATGISISGPTTGTYGVQQSYTVALDPPGSTSLGVSVTLADTLGSTLGNNPTPNLTTASPFQVITLTPTAVGTHVLSVTNNGGLTNPAIVNDVISYATVTAGAIVPNLTSISASQIVVDLSGYTLNVGAVASFAWEESLTPSGVFSAVGTNSATFTRTGLGAGVTRFYRCTVTDSISGGTATAPIQSADTYDSLMILGCLGDSIMTFDHISGAAVTIANLAFNAAGTEVDLGPNATGSIWSAFVQSMTNRNISPITSNVRNRGHSGSSTGSFWAAGVATAQLIADAVSLSGAGVTHLIFMLGANDARNIAASYATYKSNVQNIITYLFANIGSLVSVVVFPPYMWAANADSTNFTAPATVVTANDFIYSCIGIGVDMQAAFAAGKVYDGGSELFHTMANAPTTGVGNWFDTGVHPNNLSAPKVAQLFAKGFVRNIMGVAGTYTAASNVRSGTDRGDGTLGTLVVPVVTDVRSGVVFDNGSVGTFAGGGGGGAGVNNPINTSFPIS